MTGVANPIGALKPRETTLHTGASPRIAVVQNPCSHMTTTCSIKKCALRSLIGALWLFLSPINVSADQAGLILGLDHRTVRDLFSNFRAWLTPIVDRLNEELVVGSAGADTELDEISFRSKALDDQAAWRN